jgi:hypothetical protein
MRGAIPPLPDTSLWRGAQLSSGKTLHLPFTFSGFVPLLFAIS